MIKKTVSLLGMIIYLKVLLAGILSIIIDFETFS